MYISLSYLYVLVIADCRSFIAKFINTVFKCKPISTVGAEQVAAMQGRLVMLCSKNTAWSYFTLYIVVLFLHALINLHQFKISAVALDF